VIGQCSLVLGDECRSDSECPANAWCSTVPGYTVCSPRLFASEPYQLDFVLVPAGTFDQGTTGATDQERPYTATITRDYWVGRTEVTQGQWRAATGGINPSCFQSMSGTSCNSTNSNDSGPAERMDWYSALAYANWLSNQSDLQECYALTGCSDPASGWHDGAHSGCSAATFVGPACTGYRLLTESEWERASRGGTFSTFFWGESASSSVVQLYAWYSINSSARTNAVASLSSNNYGLFDTQGNVEEFVWDWVILDSGGQWHAYPTEPTVDYVGPANGFNRGARGGSYGFPTQELRAAHRGQVQPTSRLDITGFRLARTVP
jgi:sulfatase modifying factor 1